MGVLRRSTRGGRGSGQGNTANRYLLKARSPPASSLWSHLLASVRHSGPSCRSCRSCLEDPFTRNSERLLLVRAHARSLETHPCEPSDPRQQTITAHKTLGRTVPEADMARRPAWRDEIPAGGERHCLGWLCPVEMRVTMQRLPCVFGSFHRYGKCQSSLTAFPGLDASSTRTYVGDGQNLSGFTDMRCPLS